MFAALAGVFKFLLKHPCRTPSPPFKVRVVYALFTMQWAETEMVGVVIVSTDVCISVTQIEDQTLYVLKYKKLR